MAEGNVEMHSANENEEHLLQSDEANVPEQNPRSPPREIRQEERRVRRMNRQEREQREIARNRRRENYVRRRSRHHRAGSEDRHHRARQDRQISRDMGHEHQRQHLQFRRSKLTCEMDSIPYHINLFHLLQNDAIAVDRWDILKRIAEALQGNVRRKKLHSLSLTGLRMYIID